jgi:putative ABC transport system permease protein
VIRLRVVDCGDALLLQPRRLECEMFQDLRYGMRILLKNPGFTLIAVVTLSLGIGANTAIFSVINALLLSPLPYPRSEQLIWVEEVSKTHPVGMVFGAHFLDWQEQSQSLEGIAAYSNWERGLTGAGEPERVVCGEVSPNFFSLLGAEPFAKGRNFTAAEDRPGGERVVILSHELWRRRYGGDPEIIGKSLALDDESYTIVGVLPERFRFFRPFELWLPLALDAAAERNTQRSRLYEVVARLKPGATREQARAEMEMIRQRSEAKTPHGQQYADAQTSVVFLQDKLLGDTRRSLLALTGAVWLILLIACANVANLLLARAIDRRRESAIRAALGAGRFRLARQTLTECLLLAGAGGVAGLLLAVWLTKLLSALISTETVGALARMAVITIDRRTLCFTLLVSLLTGLLCGLAPAFQLVRPDLNAALKDGARGASAEGRRLRSALLVSEVALAALLLIGAGLLIRSFVKLLGVDQGYSAGNLLTARLTLPARYDKEATRAQFYDRVLQSIAAAPGVTGVGATSLLPLTTRNLAGWLRLEGRPVEEGRSQPPVYVGSVNPDYFRVMGIGLRKGRFFNDGDRAGAPSVALLTESLASRLFPGEDPLGKRLFAPTSGAEWTTVVGVVGDVRHKGLERALEPTVYLSYWQAPPVRMALVIRGTVAPLSLAPVLREAARAVDPALPVHDVMTMETRMANAAAARRFNLLLLGALAALALLLACVGVYGVISYDGAQRTREVGIRMALGAQRADVLRLFIKQGMALVILGLAVGLAGAFALARLMTSLLFGVSPYDPGAFAGAALLLSSIALVACYLPAKRATKADPLIAIRHE